MRFLFTAQRARAAGTGDLVQRGVQPILDKPLADTPDRALAGVQRGGDLLVRLLLAGVQENLRPIDYPRGSYRRGLLCVVAVARHR